MKLLTTPSVLALALFISACEEKKAPSEQETTSPVASVPYVGTDGGLPIEPQTYEISNPSGKTIKVRIIGHDTQEVLFVRLSDNKPFRWKINQLSQADQKMVRSLPVSNELSSSYQNLENSPYIANRKREVYHLNKELQEMNLEIESLRRVSRSGSSPKIRGLEKQIAAKMNKVAEVEAEIDGLNSR